MSFPETSHAAPLVLDRDLDEAEVRTLQAAVDEALEDVRSNRVHGHEEALEILDRFGRG